MENNTINNKGANAFFYHGTVKIGYALRNLNDRSILNQSPLARLTYVEKLAKEQYSSHILPRGLALKEVLIDCIEKINNELGTESALSRACQYLMLSKEGFNCREISNKLGLSREHVSRVYRPKDLALLTQEFYSIVESNK